MSSNTSKLLRVLSSQKKLSPKLYETLMNDSSLPMEVKKKVTLYYKGDKRLSVVKFQELIKKKGRKSQKGGGWKIGAVGAHQYGVQADGQKIEAIQPLIIYPTTPATPSPTVSPIQEETFKYDNKNYKLEKRLGEGAFAEVYDVVNIPAITFGVATQPAVKEDEIVVKLFKPHSSSSTLLIDTEACINDFISAFHDKIEHTSLPIRIKNANGSYAPYNIFVTRPATVTSFGISSTNLQPPVEKRGYVMRKLSPILTTDISSLLKTFTPALTTILKCMENTQSIPFRFIHGDIKIENMLEDTSKKIVMTDMDGVFVYDIEKLQHVSNKVPMPYNRPIYMTPACTHPILPWYTNKLREGFDFVNGKYSFEQSGMTGMSSVNATNYHMFNWKIMWAHMGSNQMVQTVKMAIMKVLNTRYGGGDDAYAKAVSSIFSGDQKFNWLRDQLANIDMYSLGASALFHYIKQLYELRSKGQNVEGGVAGQLRELFEFAIDTINRSLILILPPYSGIGGSKKTKGGAFEVLTNQYATKIYATKIYATQRRPAHSSPPVKYQDLHNEIKNLVLQNEPNAGGDIDIANQTIIWNPPSYFPDAKRTTLTSTEEELSWTP